MPGDPPVIGHYRVLGRVGTGGMGVVYLARSREARLVAIKTLHPSYADVEDLRRRFTAEAEYGRRVAAYTARVIEDATDAPHPYLVTEFIEGPTLSRIVEDDGPLSSKALEDVAVGVATALMGIHDAGLVHRDLKPDNVLLADEGPRVIDFGIAHEVDMAGGHTEAGVIMGSPGWIAPERLLGASAVAASDVFSWGCLVVFAATGSHPYGTGNGPELADRILHGTPDLTGMTGRLGELAAAALAHDPAERPTAEEILRRLAMAEQPGDVAVAVAVAGEPPAKPPAKPPARHRAPRRIGAGAAAAWAVAAAAVAAAVTIAVVGGGSTGPAGLPGQDAWAPTPGPPSSAGPAGGAPSSAPTRRDSQGPAGWKPVGDQAGSTWAPNGVDRTSSPPFGSDAPDGPSATPGMPGGRLPAKVPMPSSGTLRRGRTGQGPLSPGPGNGSGGRSGGEGTYAGGSPGTATGGTDPGGAGSVGTSTGGTSTGAG